MTPMEHDDSYGQETGRQETLAGFLASALNMEDQISSGVYADYLERENWPVGLDEPAFHEIKRRLTTLIRDTKRHREILQRLGKETSRNERPS